LVVRAWASCLRAVPETTTGVPPTTHHGANGKHVTLTAGTWITTLAPSTGESRARTPAQFLSTHSSRHDDSSPSTSLVSPKSLNPLASTTNTFVQRVRPGAGARIRQDRRRGPRRGHTRARGPIASMEGNRPTNVLLAEYSPSHLGFTHRAVRTLRVTQGTIWVSTPSTSGGWNSVSNWP